MSEWQPISTAPKAERVLVWGNGPVRFGYLDALDNWRATHHGPLRSAPTHWMPLPEPPASP